MRLSLRTTVVLSAFAAALPFLMHFAPTANAATDGAPAYAANGDLLPGFWIIANGPTFQLAST